MIKRLLIRLMLSVQPAAPEPLHVHRCERELSVGPDLGAPSSPIAKLSADEALRCFGVVQGGR